MACHVFACGHARALLIAPLMSWAEDREHVMILKRLIGLVFAGALAFSAAAAEIVVRIAPPRMSWSRGGRRRPAATMCGFPGTTVGTATLTSGPREGGNSLHGRMPTG